MAVVYSQQIKGAFSPLLLPLLSASGMFIRQ